MGRKDIPTLMCVIRGHALVEVHLRMKQKVIDTLAMPAEGHLDEVLIPLLDGFFKHHRIDPRVLGRVTIQAGPIDRNSSAYRIVHTWAAALKAAQNQHK